MYAKFGVEIVFMTGICAGFKKNSDDDIDFGDIFIAESEYDYGSGKLYLTEEGTMIKPEPKMLECDFDLKGKINTFLEDFHPETQLLSVLKKSNLNLVNKIPKCHFAPGACGSYVVANKNFMNNLSNSNRKLRGLDMEGYGLYMAAHIFSRRALLIKCVSDFADSDKGDMYHKMCSFSSAWLLFEFIRYTF